MADKDRIFSLSLSCLFSTEKLFWGRPVLTARWME